MFHRPTRKEAEAKGGEKKKYMRKKRKRKKMQRDSDKSRRRHMIRGKKQKYGDATTKKTAWRYKRTYNREVQREDICGSRI